MRGMVGYSFEVRGRSISEQDLCSLLLARLWGEKNANCILQQMKYMMYAYIEDDYARKRLVRKRINRVLCLELEEHGIALYFTCRLIDGICIANVIAW